MKRLLRGTVDDGLLFAQFSQAHNKGDGMFKCGAIFSRIGLLIYWVNPQQQVVVL